jgi:hypothetical protein
MEHAMTITVFVGDNDPGLATVAQKTDPKAFLVDHKNYKKFLSGHDSNDVTVYTSFSDLPKITARDAVLFEILKKADVVFYCPPAKWSDYSDDFSWNSNQAITEYFLYHAKLINNNVHGLDLTGYQNSDYLALADVRKTQTAQLWVSGGSVPHGVGVSADERFGTLISKKLDLAVSHLTKTGCSIEWAKDQILRSDIRADDIVVWQLTPETRAPKAINKKVMAEKNPDILLDETSLYRAVTSVHQVVNFCKKTSARLVMIPVDCSEHLQLLIHDLDEYCQLPYQTRFLDLGTDRVHPGPQQHQVWAEIICNHLLKY